MRINHNIAALRSLHQLTKSNNSLETSLERLSSGLRINRAADDAAGLAITQKMDSQIKGLNQADRNAMDGISLIQTAEGALGEVHDMLQRIRELSVQAANGTYDDTDRDTIQDEVDELLEEVDRIARDTEFNEISLLSGDIDRIKFSDNMTVGDVDSISDDVDPGTYSVAITAPATQTTVAGAAASGTLFDGSSQATVGGSIYINGEQVDIAIGDTNVDVFNTISSTCGELDITLSSSATPFDNGESLLFTADEYGAENITVTGDPTLLTALGLNAPVTTTGQDVTVGALTNFPTGAIATTSGQDITISGTDGFEMKVISATAAGTMNITVLETGPLNLQIGANEGQNMEVRIKDSSTEALGISDIDLTRIEGAQEAIETIDNAIGYISSIRSKLGAYQNRLEHTSANLTTASENMTASLSRILDVDMAEEMATYTQQNVIQQAGTSMLAQANQRPQSILQLLE